MPSSRKSLAVVSLPTVRHRDLARAARRIDEHDAVAAVVDAGLDAESVSALMRSITSPTVVATSPILFKIDGTA